ncbi:hypothetical protein ACEWH9_02640 [Vibrio diabolicus]|uniref:hypothetical protein n=1 Tax=Vibrio diabolicus TaxID=50719 RepID=UPI0035A98C84
MSSIITPSQYLFGMWKDLCGGTSVCSAVKISLSSPSEPSKFLTAYKNFYDAAKGLHFDIELGDDSYGQMSVVESISDQAHLSCYEYSQVAVDDVNDFVESEVNALLCMPLGISSHDNHFLRVVKINDNELLVFLVVEHLYADGISVDNLLNSYLQQVGMVIGSKSTQISTEPVPDLSDYQQYQETLNSFVIDYSKSMMTKKYFWSPEGKHLDYLVGHYKMMSSLITVQDLQKITNVVASHGVSLFSYMASCFAKAFFKTNLGESELLLQIPTHGRSYADKTIHKSQVGCFAQSFLLHFEREKVEISESFEVEAQVNEHTAKCTLNEVDQVTARRNARSLASSNIKSKISDEEYAITLRRGMPTNVYFSFYGSSSIDCTHSDVDISSCFLGTTNLSGGLDVMSVLTPNGLVVSFNYDSKFFSRSVIEEFRNMFNLELRNGLDGADLIKRTGKVHANQRKESALLIEIINEFSLDPITADDGECHLEIDLGLDSLSKTQILARAIATLGLNQGDICRERFYTSSTLDEWFSLFCLEEICA